ncbi:MAG: hypothetical protein FWE25_04005 [Lachnospiraceae bacterium]|nr:hypothetical protein [Lachnospiraceae bacterium]
MKKICITVLCVCILFTGCAVKREKRGFFAWMDGYLAMAQGEEFGIALTYFFEPGNAPFTTDEIYSLSFGGVKQVEIVNFSITSLDSDMPLQYAAYSFDLDIKAMEKGVFKTDTLVATMSNNSSITFRIGEWVFDVEEFALPPEAENKINVWSSPAAGSNPRVFAYAYSIIDDIKIKEIWLSEHVVLSEENGLPLSNEIELPQIINAPINFIRPKIILDTGGEEMVALGMSYYSGAINIQKDVLEKSKELNGK